MWFSEKTERPNSTVELGELEPIFFFLPLKLLPHLLKRMGEFNVIMFPLLVCNHARAGRYKLGNISVSDPTSVILNPSAGLAVTPLSVCWTVYVVEEGEEGECFALM